MRRWMEGTLSPTSSLRIRGWKDAAATPESLATNLGGGGVGQRRPAWVDGYVRRWGPPEQKGRGEGAGEGEETTLTSLPHFSCYPQIGFHHHPIVTGEKFLDATATVAAKHREAIGKGREEETKGVRETSWRIGAQAATEEGVGGGRGERGARSTQGGGGGRRQGKRRAPGGKRGGCESWREKGGFWVGGRREREREGDDAQNGSKLHGERERKREKGRREERGGLLASSRLRKGERERGALAKWRRKGEGRRRSNTCPSLPPPLPPSVSVKHPFRLPSARERERERAEEHLSHSSLPPIFCG